MQSKLLVVAKREYFTTIRKPSFWISTLFFPAFMIVIGLVSGLASASVENIVKDLPKNIKAVYVVDQAGIVNPALIQTPLVTSDSFEAASAAVRNNEVTAAILIPSDFLQSKKIVLNIQDLGVFAGGSVENLGTELVKQSILSRIDTPALISAYSSDYATDVTTYNTNGERIPSGLERLTLPTIVLVLYLVATTFASSYLLRSVSEEKENRMIEVVLSAATPRQLVWGKVLGQLSIVITQLVTLIALSLVVVAVAKLSLPIDLSTIRVSAGQLIMAAFYLITGFLLMAGFMVVAASAVPTYREAQSFSSVFIVLAVFPLYLITVLLADPNGTIAMVASYFPLTAPMVLLIRTSLGVVSVAESIFSGVVILLYIFIVFYLAFKVFEFGALEFNRTISFKQLVRRLRFN